MSTRHHILSLCLALVACVPTLHAQQDPLAEANRKYQSGDLAGARAILDEVVRQPGHQRSSEAWVLRGFVLKDIYKGLPSGEEADAVRDEALASLFTSTVLDTARQYLQSSQQAYDFLCKTQYNDAARALNEMQDERAIRLYARYKENLLRIDPGHAFLDRDIEFNNALATVYTKRYNQEREQTTYFDKAVEVYKKVLALDSNNYGANYNLATLYYNRGVYNIQRISVGTTIPDLNDIQRVAKEFFTLALPYMKKAHEMNPKRRETLLGLEGIHYSLQETEKSEHYRFLYDQLDNEGPPKDK